MNEVRELGNGDRVFTSFDSTFALFKEPLYLGLIGKLYQVCKLMVNYFSSENRYFSIFICWEVEVCRKAARGCSKIVATSLINELF